jgi:hypothetical protein
LLSARYPLESTVVFRAHDQSTEWKPSEDPYHYELIISLRLKRFHYAKINILIGKNIIITKLGKTAIDENYV